MMNWYFRELAVGENGNFIQKKSRRSEERSMKSNYDFSQAIRGKYAHTTVLGIPPVNSPQSVVKVAIVSKARS